MTGYKGTDGTSGNTHHFLELLRLGNNNFMLHFLLQLNSYCRTRDDINLASDP